MKNVNNISLVLIPNNKSFSNNFYEKHWSIQLIKTMVTMLSVKINNYINRDKYDSIKYFWGNLLNFFSILNNRTLLERNIQKDISSTIVIDTVWMVKIHFMNTNYINQDKYHFPRWFHNSCSPTIRMFTTVLIGIFDNKN